MKELLKGKFIVLDGPDGCGKSTQSKLLRKWAQDNQVETVSFRDPGTTVIGEKIRDILLDPAHKEMNTRCELLLYMAARAQLYSESIAPALNQGKCVILDRWLSSTCAYQGCAGGFGIQKVVKLALDSLERAWPDITIILDIDLEDAKPRLSANLDRMEQKSKDYHEKVRQGFLELAKEMESFKVVDAADDIDTVHENVMNHIKAALG
ncbi:MAG: dTMP kinase [Planctomycetes bacterium]|nr:dTMP kinase [Planctomycetota bacterium]